MFFQKKKEIVLTATTMGALNLLVRVVEVLAGKRAEIAHVTIENDTSLYGAVYVGDRTQRMTFTYVEGMFLKLGEVGYQIGTRNQEICIRDSAMVMLTPTYQPYVSAPVLPTPAWSHYSPEMNSPPATLSRAAHYFIKDRPLYF